MSIEFIRLDDRLIHGQVVAGWTRLKGVNTILVVDDPTAGNKMQQQLMKMATPPGVTPVFLTIDQVVEKLNAGNYDKKKCMLLFKNVYTLRDLVAKGLDIKDVNFGNMRGKDSKIQLFNHVFATEEEVQIMKELSDKGVKMVAQAMPSGQICNLNDVVSKQ